MPRSPDTASTSQNKCAFSVIADDSDGEDTDSRPEPQRLFSSDAFEKKLTLLSFTARKWCVTASSEGKSMTSVLINNLDLEDTDENPHEKGMIYLNLSTCPDNCSDILPGKNKCATLSNPVAVDVDSLLIDVDVQLHDDNPPTREDKQQDVDQFFCMAIVKDVNGKLKKYCTCKLCP